MRKISAVQKIVNTVTGDSYIGSSKNVKRRWAEHKRPLEWHRQPNNRMYQDMQKYGVDKFRFQILCPVMPERLKQVEQECIEMLKPTYNNYNAKGFDVERNKEYHKKYRQTEKGKEAQKKYQKKYNQSEKGKETRKKYHKYYQQTEKGKEVQKKYRQTEKGKEANRKANKKYSHQLCLYNGEILTLETLRSRFRRAGISHAAIEAKKYLKETE